MKGSQTIVNLRWGESDAPKGFIVLDIIGGSKWCFPLSSLISSELSAPNKLELEFLGHWVEVRTHADDAPATRHAILSGDVTLLTTNNGVRFSYAAFSDDIRVVDLCGS